MPSQPTSTVERQAQKPCVACRSQIPADAMLCKECKTLQKSMSCKNCSQPILEGSKRCNACASYQNWRRHFTISATVIGLLGGMIGVVAAVLPAVSYFRDYHSQTRFKVTSSNANHIYLKVWNTGRRPSTLVGYHLFFDDAPHDEIILELDTVTREAANNVIAPGTPVKIGLTRSLPGTIPFSRHVEQYVEDQLRKVLADKVLANIPLTLALDVEESSDASGESFHTRRDRFRANRISEFTEGSIRP